MGFCAANGSQCKCSRALISTSSLAPIKDNSCVSKRGADPGLSALALATHLKVFIRISDDWSYHRGTTCHCYSGVCMVLVI